DGLRSVRCLAIVPCEGTGAKGLLASVLIRPGEGWFVHKASRPFDKVTVFGGATVDRIAASVHATVLGASNPGTARGFPGGVGMNVARALGQLGHAVSLVTRIGRDADGDLVLAAGRAAGVNFSKVSVSETAPTATYHAAFDHRGALIVGIAAMTVFDEISPA